MKNLSVWFNQSPNQFDANVTLFFIFTHKIVSFFLFNTKKDLYLAKMNIKMHGV